MEISPGDAYEEPQRESKLEAKPESQPETRDSQPNNVSEIIGAAFGGILTTVATLLECAGNSIAAIWVLFASLCCYALSFGSYLHERGLLPAPIDRRRGLFLIGVLAALFVFTLVVDRSIRSDTAIAAARERRDGRRADLLTPEVRERLLDDLRQLPKASVSVYVSTLHDGETYSFGGEIVGLLRDAGCLRDFRSGELAGGERFGISILYGGMAPMPTARKLHAALENAGLPDLRLAPRIGLDFPMPGAQLFIGPRR